MIAGGFDARERPILRARLLVPRFGIDDEVSFMVDTGAVSTCLHPFDAELIGFPFDELIAPFDMVGVGGNSRYYREPALLLLAGTLGDLTFDLTISIAKPQSPSTSNPRPVVNRLPSLLGRDVLNRLRMDYDFPAGRLEFFAS